MAAQNLQQEVQEKIRTGLATARATLGVPLLFGHLCKGNLEKPGVLRVSAIAGDAPKLDGVANPCDHDTAFLRHVQRFGREKTLLNWLVCWTRSALATHDRNNSNVSATASFLVHADTGALVKMEKQPLSIQATLSKDLLRSLVPEGLAKTYLTTLYGDALEPAEFCGRSIPELELLTAKMQTLRMLKKCADGTKNFGELCQAYLAGGNGGNTPAPAPSDGQMLQLLCALQIAFAYAEVFMPTCLDAGGFVSVSRPHEDTLKSVPINDHEKMVTVPIFAASTSVINQTEVVSKQTTLVNATAQTPLSTALHNTAEIKGAATPKLIGPKTKFSTEAAASFSKTVKVAVPHPPFEAWSDNASQWIALLVSDLQWTKHEGHPLEFIFVLGDLAQIRDSSAFELLEFTDSSIDFPPVIEVTDFKKQREFLEAAKTNIEKQNYFWFQAGRYALLWDFTLPDSQPRYLLGLKDSSWHVFIANARNRQPSATANAALVVGYLDDRGGGGLIVGGEHAFSLSQNGEWIQRGDALSDRVEAYLKTAGGGILNEAEPYKEITKLVKALIAVSNDPDTGCMLVLANSSTCPPFETMGHPWKVSPADKTGTTTTGDDRLSELSDDKLVALLGMDGAACVWKDGDSCRIAFRKLARPPAPNDETRPVFSKAKDALSGEGSRKWSAFLAASRADVNLIVAVSQDGPVHFYSPFEFAKGAYNGDSLPASIKDCTDDKQVVHDKVS